MINYALEWKKSLKLHQHSYEDFVTDYPALKNGIYMEKIDGMLGALIHGKDGTFFQTTTGNVIQDIPVLFEYQNFFKQNKIKEAIIPGELAARKNGTVLPFNETQSIVKKSYVPANKDLIHHYPVDIVSLNGKKMNFKQALPFIIKSSGKTQHIVLPEISMGDIELFRKLYNDVKKKPGFDGVIARDVGGKNHKIKFTSTADLVIIGAGKEGMPAWGKGQVSYLMTAFIDKNGLFRTSSKVGTGFTQMKRAALYKMASDLTLYKSNGDLYVKPMLVIEVKFFRYRMTPTMTYKFNSNTNRYEVAGEMKSITFSNSTFERIRQDKKPNRYDTRLEQLPEWRY